MDGQTYRRTVSADDSGFQYELKMTALAALRLYNSSDEFYLANNFDAGEKFDDLVFAVNQHGNWATWFVQLKHKQKSSIASRKITLPSLIQETKANKNDYNLVKYFDSYKAISKKFHPGSKDVIFGRNYDGARFVVFTNAVLGDDPALKDLVKVPIAFLSTNGDKEINLTFDAKKDAFLLKKIPEKALLADFLNKFCLCSNQASEDLLDTQISLEIKRASPELSVVEVNYINGQIKDYIRRWYQTREYLTKENIRMLLLKTSAEAQAGKKSEVNMTFLPAFLKQVTDNLFKEPIMIYASNAANTLLCEAALRQLSVFEEPNTNTNLIQLENEDFRKMVMEKWKTINAGYTLIINLECDTIKVSLKVIADFIGELGKINKKNFIIMLTTSSNDRSQKLAGLVKAKKRNFNCSLINIHEHARIGILDSLVLYQGYKTPLSSIMPSKKILDNVLPMSTISDLLRGQMPEIGSKPVEPVSYYITRVLIRNCISPTVFELVFSGVLFAISGVTFERALLELTKYIPSDIIASAKKVINSTNSAAKVVVLEDGVTLRDVSAKLGPMHWLEKHRNLWTWKNSTADVTDIVKFTSHIFDYTATDNIMKIQDKVVLVIAEPGMGKSTLLVHMAAETKRLNPHVWVVLVSLNDFTDRMASDTFMANLESNVKAIVAEAAGVTPENKFNARLFDHCYDVTGRMIILLDGFDEIAPYYTKEGLALLNVLQNSKIERVWVTARPIMREQLQKNTNIIPYNIKAFTPKDQQEFLLKFWKRSFPDMKTEQLTEFISKVLSLVSASFEGESDEFYGIPLQTRMLAETFEKELTVFQQSGVLSLPAKINRLELFEAFVGKKLNILDGKGKVVATNAVSRNQAQMWRNAQETRLMKLALLTMLNVDQLARMLPPLLKFEILQLKDEVAGGEEKTGIVLSYKGEVPQFIHRTFAEYFVARFFEAHLRENVEFLTSDIFRSSSFNLVRYFLDHMLAKGCRIHEAVLNQNVDELSSLLNTATVDVNMVDKAGRTALHLAAAQPGSEDLIRVLLDAGAETAKVDEILKWTAMQFALPTGDIGNVAPLIGPSHFSNFPREILPIDWTTFKKAIEGDYYNLFLGLLENGIVSVLGVDVLPPNPWIDDSVIEGMTYLHLAAAFNAVTILKYLLRNDTRDSKLWLMERVNSESDTALLVAAKRGYSKAASLLLQAGANIQATTKLSKNIFDLAVELSDTVLFTTALAALQKNQQISPEALLIGPLTNMAGNKSEWACLVLNLLLSSYPQLLNIATKKDNLPLIAIAVSKGNDFAVKVMCDLGVDINQTVRSSSLLHLAIERGWESTARLLLGFPQVNIEAQDDLGRTPLYTAVYKRNLTIMQLLLDRGADFKCCTKEGNNLSHAAAYSADATLISRLVSLGVDFRSVNSTGESAMNILSSSGENVMVDFLTSLYEPQPIVQSVEPALPLVQGLSLNDAPSTGGPVPAAPKRKKSKKGVAPIVGAVTACNASENAHNTSGVAQTPTMIAGPQKIKKVKPPKQKKNSNSGNNVSSSDNDLLMDVIRQLTGQLHVDQLKSLLQLKTTTPAVSNGTKKQKGNPPQQPKAKNKKQVNEAGGGKPPVSVQPKKDKQNNQPSQAGENKPPVPLPSQAKAKNKKQKEDVKQPASSNNLPNMYSARPIQDAKIIEVPALQHGNLQKLQQPVKQPKPPKEKNGTVNQPKSKETGNKEKKGKKSQEPVAQASC